MKKVLLVLSAVAFLSACTITTHTVSNNPVGTKVGDKKAWSGPNMQVGYKDAAGDGMIKKIGTTEQNVMWILGFTRYTTIVTGE